jgi:hypothetical protein
MHIIAFITHGADIRHTLNHIGFDSEASRLSPARGPHRFGMGVRLMRKGVACSFSAPQKS